MSDKIILGISHGNGRVDVRGPVADEFEMASALYMLLEQASKDDHLAGGSLVGAEIGEPILMQSMSFQRQNLELRIGGRRFRVSVQQEV